MDNLYDGCFKGNGYKMGSIFSPRVKLPSIKSKDAADVNSPLAGSNFQPIWVS